MAQFYNPYEPVDQHGSILPHWQQGEVTIFVTWRLADSLPSERLEQLRREREIWLAKNEQPWNPRQTEEYHELFSVRIESWLDQGQGTCCLRASGLRHIVVEALKYFDDKRYLLDSFVVMPNHLHVLFQPRAGHTLKEILHTWKSFTAKKILAAMQAAGPLWGEGYWDRLIRNEAHLQACRRYIQQNPVKAKLRPEEYSLYPD